MSQNITFSNNDGAFDKSEISLARPVRFCLLLLFNAPSVLCDFCIIFHVMLNRNRRHALHNHAIILIIIFNLPVQLIDINFHLVFLHYGFIRPSVPIVCLIWWLVDYGFYIGGILGMMWLAIERHILVFHSHWVANRRGQFFFHYLPMAIIFTYVLLFYFIAVFFLNCQNTYSYTLPVCNASPCYQTYGIVGMWEFIVNTTIPIFVEGFSSAYFIIRVQRQKRRLRRTAEWQKLRRLTLQLLLMSSINMIFNLPIFLIPLAHYCGLPPQYGVQPELYFFFLGYFVIFLFPFVSLSQYPELRKNIVGTVLCRRPRVLHTTNIITPAVIAN